MKLRFHLSVWNHDNKFKDVCCKALHKASIIIRDEIIKALEKEIRTLRTKRNINRTNLSIYLSIYIYNIYLKKDVVA